MKTDINQYSQVRDTRHIHLAQQAWETATASGSLSLLCGQHRTRLKVIDPIHFERFGWAGQEQARCPKCQDVLTPKPKKGAA